MKLHRLAAGAAVLTLVGAALASAAPIPVNVSTNHATEDLRGELWRTHARIRATVLSEPNVHLIAQRVPHNYTARLDHQWSIIQPTRDARCGVGTMYGERGTLVPGTRYGNCALTPARLYQRATDRLATPGVRWVVIDEIATGTMPSVDSFLRLADARARQGVPEAQRLVKSLAFFVVGGDGVRVKRFPSYTRRWLRESKAPVWAELYGGKLRDVRKPGPSGVQNGRKVLHLLKGTGVQTMRRAGWNVRPMLSAKPMHVGTGRASLVNLRQRFRMVQHSTGMIAGVWHLNSSDGPAVYGLGHMVYKEIT